MNGLAFCKVLERLLMFFILQLVHEGHLNSFLMIPHLPNLISDQLKQERLDLDMLLHGNSRS
jgi:hypothetical protein